MGPLVGQGKDFECYFKYRSILVDNLFVPHKAPSFHSGPKQPPVSGHETPMELQPGPTALPLVTVMVILTHVTRLTVNFRTFVEVPPDTKRALLLFFHWT